MGAIIARWQLVQREAWHAWHGMAGGNGGEREEGWKRGGKEKGGDVRRNISERELWGLKDRKESYDYESAITQQRSIICRRAG